MLFAENFPCYKNEYNLSVLVIGDNNIRVLKIKILYTFRQYLYGAPNNYKPVQGIGTFIAYHFVR